MSDWAAGWYEDPELAGQIRYWDGNGWTAIRHATPENFPLGRPGPDASGQGRRAQTAASAQPVEQEPEPQPPTRPEPQTPTRPEPQPPTRQEPPSEADPVAGPPQRSTGRRPLLIGLGIGGMLVAALVIGALLLVTGPLGRPDPGESLAEPADDAAASEWGRTYSGEGDHALRVPAGGDPGLVKVTYRGDTNFTLDSVDEDGDSTGLLFNSIGWTSGTAAYDLGSRGPSAWLSVDTEGRWSVTFQKLSTAPEFGQSEKGSRTKVLRWDGQASPMAVTYTPTGRASLFTVMAYGSQERGDQLIVEGEKFTGTVEVPAGTEYLVVETDGDWELTPK